MKNTGNVLIALAGGLAVGAVLGILYAPDTGEETRKKIKRKVLDAKDEISSKFSNVVEDLTKTAKKKRSDFEEELEEVISHMSGKAEDIINSMEKKLEELKAKTA